MKIINQILPQNLSLVSQNTNQPKHYLTSKLRNDTFETQQKQSVSFKSNYQNLAKRILKDPNLAKKFSEMFSVGILALMGIAAGKKISETASDESLVENILDDMSNDAIQFEIENLRKENAELKEKLKAQETIADTLETPPEENITPETVNPEQNLIKYQFPRRRGRLSGDLNNLKQFLHGREINEKSANKLTEICLTIMSNKNSLIDFGFDANSIISEVPENITREELEIYIDKIYAKLHPENQVTETEVAIAEKKPNAELVFSTNGTIDHRVLAELEKEKKDRIKPDVNVEVLDPENEIYTFKIPGTLNPNLMKNLKDVLLKFENKISNTVEKPHWMVKHQLTKNITEQDIKNEIRRFKSSSPFQNITENDVVDIQRILEKEPKLQEIFSLHGALRFIDRFINFDEGNIKGQCSEKIDLLYKAIQKALSNGVKVESYTDNKNNYGARFVIESDKDKNPEAFELCGSYDLIIGFCEAKQNGPYNSIIKIQLLAQYFSDIMKVG